MFQQLNIAKIGKLIGEKRNLTFSRSDILALVDEEMTEMAGAWIEIWCKEGLLTDCDGEFRLTILGKREIPGLFSFISHEKLLTT